MTPTAARTFEALWRDLETIGRDRDSGGYHREVWSDADLELREWFAHQASLRGCDLFVDGNGNQFAWWGDPRSGQAVMTGSHLDSVPDGGAYDGPLGVISAFAAIDVMRERGVRPVRPIVVVSFADEEGARFGVPCSGSRLLTGSLHPADALALRDRDGRRLGEVLGFRGRDPAALGAQPDLLAGIGCFVELHVEQGRGLVGLQAPVGVASMIWPHGRWRFAFRGRADHAGTTLMSDRADPMLTYAITVLAANKQARLAGARATFGRVRATPGATNAVPSGVTGWLDARAGDDAELADLVETITRQAAERAERDGTSLEVTVESLTPSVHLDAALSGHLVGLLGDGGPAVPVLPTAAGHDAGVLSAAGVPSAMLFVRNPTGVSHSPAEHAELDDCLAGVNALARVLTELSAGDAA
ncbi:MAG: allantoate amidohydrolase [Actinomycetota bacterium]|nr:allantoate amidohydrolase [Actinomycetota bacterium]